MTPRQTRFWQTVNEGGEDRQLKLGFRQCPIIGIRLS
jgi:hypothetical protein